MTMEGRWAARAATPPIAPAALRASDKPAENGYHPGNGAPGKGDSMTTMGRSFRSWAVLLVGLVAACEDAANPGGLDVSAAADGAEAGFQPEGLPAPEVDSAAAPETLLPEVGPEVGDVPGPELFVEPGSFGYPCEKDGQCLSSFCVMTPDGGRCTVTCDGACPEGWQCSLHKKSLPDSIFICVLPFLNQCRPCKGDDDCLLNWADTGERCLAYGPAGHFCGGPCETAGPETGQGNCPDGYLCKSAADWGGKEGQFCLVESGECPCSKWFIEDQAGTACFVENDFGKCPGERACQPEGLSLCSAQTPGTEVCDGKDQDCDGETDEGAGGSACTTENEYGACAGLDECANGKLVCLADKPEPEACDGVDNNCSGKADEGYPDTDGDGLADCMEVDKDGDEVLDVDDNCPYVPNSDQLDSDLDSDGDACDPDDDDDKVADGEDCAPLDWTVFPGAAEACNGTDDDCDQKADEGFPDFDKDEVADCVDPDDDNDTFPDADDCAPTDPKSYPQAFELCDALDNDCDGDADEGYEDTDGDGKADCLDDDMDEDGLLNSKDNCPHVPNPVQEDLDGDGVGDACDIDQDGDGIGNGLDNCPVLFNPTQADLDQDGLGNACDPDLDGDGVPDAADNCPEVSNPDGADLDLDGLGDACDPDLDGDGWDNPADCEPYLAPVNPAAQEVCDGVDNDCSLIIDDGFEDYDNDGLKDCVDEDDDNDKDPDATDCEPTNKAVHSAAAEVCNGLDDDCSGGIDDDLGTMLCGLGVCAKVLPLCLDGKPNFCNPFKGASNEVCDNQDNDCDGAVDDGLGTITCGFGLCHHTVAACQGGKSVACDPKEGAADELCDGLDNDCDGLIDEALGTASCGKGVCQHAEPNCLEGVPQTCDEMKGASAEVCDGLDNDCDGAVDDNLGSTACGKGDCNHVTKNCVDGKPQPCNPMEGAAEEICDGLDNDCDGLKDDNLGKSLCGKGECFHEQANCIAGQPQACDPLLGKADEVCDGLDNDCDGYLDEALGTSACGKGACFHVVSNCLEGVPQVCDPQQGSGKEVCDFVDNDCDGVTDNPGADGCKTWYYDADQDGYGTADSMCLCAASEDYTALATGDCKDNDPAVNPGEKEICGNNVDENCDGLLDAASGQPDCSAIHDVCPGLPSGTYKVKPGAQELTVKCEMTMSGGGWTQMTGDFLAAMPGGTWEYLYVANGAWYRSPPTTQKWDWNVYTPVNGSYAYGTGAEASSAFDCAHNEQGYWGVGCSNCGGNCWKCFVHGAGYKDVAAGQTTICQDKPNVFGYGACGQPVQIYVRPQ
jgi:hypothetical protein